MTDYLAAARDHAAAVDGATFGSPAYLAHLAAITAFASLARVEALPQGADDVAPASLRHDVTPGPSPAEPSLVGTARDTTGIKVGDLMPPGDGDACGEDADGYVCTALEGHRGPHVATGLDDIALAVTPATPALVALDRAEDEAVTALIEWRKVDRIYPPEAPEAWPALLRLRDVADRLGLAR